MNRVLVIGPGGAGKSTFARQLAERTGLPLIHLDQVYWRSGWRPTADDEWRETVEQLIAGARWIIDGNYGGTLDLRLKASDTVFFLDFPRTVCLWRVIRRHLRYRGRVRPDMAAGCPERLSLEFLSWVWNYHSRRRRGILARLADLEKGKQVVILRSVAEVGEYLRQA